MSDWMLPKENDQGSVEYKYRLLFSERLRKEQLITQLNYRLNEGRGEAIYEIGVSDSGELIGLREKELTESLQNLSIIAEQCRAHVSEIRRSKGKEGIVIEVLVRKTPVVEVPIEIAVCLAGNVDSGKSTLVGTLTTGQYDDGDGLTRASVLRFLHESLSGRTSSVAVKVLGFDETGEITNYSNLKVRNSTEILRKSSKLIRFVDLAGHEKYLKTTIFGLTGNLPDYVCMVVAANSGIQPMLKEHLGLAIALQIPIFCVISKIDMSPRPVTKKTIEELKTLLKSPGLSKIPFLVRDFDDSVVVSKAVSKERVVPIFQVSNVSGQGLLLLKNFLNLLPIRQSFAEDEEFNLFIDDIFSVPGAGTVVSGTVLQGSLRTEENCFFGPAYDGTYRQVKIKSIHYRRTPTRLIRAGQFATFALAGVARDDVRKGQVLTNLGEPTPPAYWGFEADVLVLHHATTIKVGYETQLHIMTVRQQARITKMDKLFLRTGETARCEFRFLFYPEMLLPGTRFVFREGRTRGLGVITSLSEKPSNSER